MVVRNSQHIVRISRKRLSEYFSDFVRSLETKKPDTRGTYERALREFIKWFGTDTECQFRVSDIERYKKFLSSKRKLSDVSISTYLTSVRRFCEYLTSIGVLKENPALGVRGNPRPKYHSRDVLTIEELNHLFSAINVSTERGSRDYAILKTMLECGLSEIELVRADISDVMRDGEKWMLRVQGKGKTEKSDKVILPDNAKQAIDAYLLHRPEAKPDEPLFLSTGNRWHGGRMTTRGIRVRVQHYLKQIGIRTSSSRRVSAYSLRHTAAMKIVQQGATPEELMHRMRLGSLMTAEMYIQQFSSKNGQIAKSFSRKNTRH